MKENGKLAVIKMVSKSVKRRHFGLACSVNEDRAWSVRNKHPLRLVMRGMEEYHGH